MISSRTDDAPALAPRGQGDEPETGEARHTDTVDDGAPADRGDVRQVRVDPTAPPTPDQLGPGAPGAPGAPATPGDPPADHPSLPLHSPHLLAAPHPRTFHDAPAFARERYLTPIAHDLLDQDPKEGQVAKGSLWFVGSVAVGAAFSTLFWSLSAHIASEAVIADAARLFALVMFFNFVTGMGLPVAVARYGAGKPKTVWVLYLWALLYTTAASLLGIVIFALIAPLFVTTSTLDALYEWGGTAGGLLLFFLMVNGMSFALLVEVRLVTMRKWRWVMGRVLILSIVRLPFLAIPAISHSALGLLLLINGTPALTGYVGALLLLWTTKKHERAPLFPLPAEIVPAFKFASVNYVGMLAAQAPQFFIPVVAIAALQTMDYGAFYYAWQFTLVVFLVPHTIGQVVLAEGSRRKSPIGQQMRTGMVLAVGLTTLATIGAWIAAKTGMVTLLYGKSYEMTADLLPRFVAAGIPWAITSICLARARVGAQHVRTILITGSFAIFTIVPTIVMTARSGTNGTANAWLLGNMLAAAISVIVTAWVRRDPKVGLVPSRAPAEAA